MLGLRIYFWKNEACNIQLHSVQESGVTQPASQMLLLNKIDVTGGWFQKRNLKL